MVLFVETKGPSVTWDVKFSKCKLMYMWCLFIMFMHSLYRTILSVLSISNHRINFDLDRVPLLSFPCGIMRKKNILSSTSIMYFSVP